MAFSHILEPVATLQAVHLFPQILKTDLRRGRRKSVFTCWWLPPPNPFSQIAICGYAPFRRFSSLALARFLKKGEITDCPKTQRTPFKNPSGSQSRSQREMLFKKFGMLPNKQNLRFPAMPETAGFVRLYIQTPCLPSSAWLLSSPTFDKIFPKGIGRNTCLYCHDTELNTAHIFYADT